MAARSYTTIKYDDDNYGDRGGGRGDGARHQDCWESGGSVNGRFIGGHGAGRGEVVIDDRVNGVLRCFANTQSNHVPFDGEGSGEGWDFVHHL